MNSWELVKELNERAKTFRILDAKPGSALLISQEALELARVFYTKVEELYEIGRKLNEEMSGSSRVLSHVTKT